MSELKPCPFCGSEAEPLYGEEIEITCSNIKCRMYPASFAIHRSQWNTRPIEDALRARIAELESENKYLGNMPVNTVKAPDAIIYDNALDSNRELRITVKRQQDRIAELEALHDHQHLLDLADEMAKLQAENAKLVRELTGTKGDES